MPERIQQSNWFLEFGLTQKALEYQLQLARFLIEPEAN